MVRIVEEIEEEQFVCAHAERQNTKTTTCEGVSKQIRGTKRGHLQRQFPDIVDFYLLYFEQIFNLFKYILNNIFWSNENDIRIFIFHI